MKFNVQEWRNSCWVSLSYFLMFWQGNSTPWLDSQLLFVIRKLLNRHCCLYWPVDFYYFFQSHWFGHSLICLFNMRWYLLAKSRVLRKLLCIVHETFGFPENVGQERYARITRVAQNIWCRPYSCHGVSRKTHGGQGPCWIFKLFCFVKICLC